MIEVEKKFILKDSEKEKLLENAEFINEKSFTDVYFDIKNYDFTLHDMWLRTRDDEWEFKIPPQGNLKEGERTEPIGQYEEIEGKEAVKKYLDKKRISFEDCIPYCTIKTVRKKYRRNGFTLDFDEAEYLDQPDSLKKFFLLQKLWDSRFLMFVANLSSMSNVSGQNIIWLLSMRMLSKTWHSSKENIIQAVK